MCNCTSQEDFSASNIAQNGCPLSIPGECSFYDGIAIPSMGINPGDTLNTVIRKIAVYFNLLDDNVDDLSLSVAALGGSTSTTTTTTTTSGSGTTSTTTTTSTTSSGISSTVYLLAKGTSTTPTESQILAGLTSTQDETHDVTADFTSFSSTPQYCFVAIKRNGTPSIKNKWVYATNPSSLNNIGTSDDLIGVSVTVSVSGVNYDVYPTNYPTQFAEPIILKHI